MEPNSPTSEFVEAAQQFCILIERAAELSPSALLTSIYLSLPGLTRAAFFLPQVEPETIGIFEEGKPPEGVSKSHRSLLEKTGKFDRYFLVFDPQEPIAKDPVDASLAADLDEIYQDLKRALRMG